MPVRQLKKSYRGQPSLLMTQKAVHKAVFAESTLERDFYVLLKFLKWVVSYEEQPFKVPYINENGGAGKWTPDTLVELQVGYSIEKWLYEVKYRVDIKENWAELKPKFRGAILYCKNNDINRFKLMTEVEIRSGSKLKNAKLFLKNRNSKVVPGVIEYILTLLANCVTMKTRTMLESLQTQGLGYNEACVAVYHLIANHRIGLDLDAPFTYESELWLLIDGLLETYPSLRLPRPV
ncbi:MAG: hypothetical protein CVU69_09785 [Deltaproteobacteria bacterium HGW-Deltaproteobacteria-4]|nr:MAG: hypothetical protein CVU69_09785 [Deltaproteobacteria bacterium HGW-Deltaproteobacteria-4]